MTLSDRVIKICEERHHRHDTYHAECRSCPIETTCNSTKTGSQQITDDWKLRMNAAAEMVQ